MYHGCITMGKANRRKNHAYGVSSLLSYPHPMPPRYSKKASRAVEKELHEYKRGRAHSGPKKRPVRSRRQAIAIGLSIARKAGAKVPRKQ